MQTFRVEVSAFVATEKGIDVFAGIRKVEYEHKTETRTIPICISRTGQGGAEPNESTIYYILITLYVVTTTRKLENQGPEWWKMLSVIEAYAKGVVVGKLGPQAFDGISYHIGGA